MGYHYLKVAVMGYQQNVTPPILFIMPSPFPKIKHIQPEFSPLPRFKIVEDDPFRLLLYSFHPCIQAENTPFADGFHEPVAEVLVGLRIFVPGFIDQMFLAEGLERNPEMAFYFMRVAIDFRPDQFAEMLPIEQFTVSAFMAFQ